MCQLGKDRVRLRGRTPINETASDCSGPFRSCPRKRPALCPKAAASGSAPVTGPGHGQLPRDGGAWTPAHPVPLPRSAPAGLPGAQLKIRFIYSFQAFPGPAGEAVFLRVDCSRVKTNRHPPRIGVRVSLLSRVARGSGLVQAKAAGSPNICSRTGSARLLLGRKTCRDPRGIRPNIHARGMTP